jgi:hypothetical protein
MYLNPEPRRFWWVAVFEKNPMQLIVEADWIAVQEMSFDEDDISTSFDRKALNSFRFLMYFE